LLEEDETMADAKAVKSNQNKEEETYNIMNKRREERAGKERRPVSKTFV
jgi:hypothetical protein